MYLNSEPQPDSNVVLTRLIATYDVFELWFWEQYGGNQNRLIATYDVFEWDRCNCLL